MKEEVAMSRAFAIFALAGLWTALVAADAARPGQRVDLNAPGALEALNQSRPAHFEKVRKILEGVLQRPDRDVPRWMQVSFGASDVDYRPVVLTSHPPKRRLSFALDDTHYEAVVTLTTVRGEVVPLR
jgi:hypothetical protein